MFSPISTITAVSEPPHEECFLLQINTMAAVKPVCVTATGFHTK